VTINWPWWIRTSINGSKVQIERPRAVVSPRETDQLKRKFRVENLTNTDILGATFPTTFPTAPRSRMPAGRLVSSESGRPSPTAYENAGLKWACVPNHSANATKSLGFCRIPKANNKAESPGQRPRHAGSFAVQPVRRPGSGDSMAWFKIGQAIAPRG
jgi:hypothetical protein